MEEGDLSSGQVRSFKHEEIMFVDRNNIGYKSSVTSKKSPNVYKSCPKMISLEKLKFLTLLQKLLRLYEIWVN